MNVVIKSGKTTQPLERWLKSIYEDLSNEVLEVQFTYSDNQYHILCVWVSW